MPKKITVTKEAILEAALNILRRDGEGAIHARGVAKELSVSTQPIFSHFENMQDLKQALCDRAWEEYKNFYTKEIESNKYPKYKASGMAYIKFANAEPALFNYLYSGKDSHSKKADTMFWGQVSEIEDTKGVSNESATLFHLQMWVYVHGIATLTSNKYIELDEETTSKMVSNVYKSLHLNQD